MTTRFSTPRTSLATTTIAGDMVWCRTRSMVESSLASAGCVAREGRMNESRWWLKEKRVRERGADVQSTAKNEVALGD